MTVPEADPLYDVDISTEVEPFLSRWASLRGAVAAPFHSVLWLRSWYATLGNSDGRAPLLVGVRRRDNGSEVMLLALCSRRAGGLRLVEFADATVVDYNQPLLAVDWAGNGADADTALRRARRIREEIHKALGARFDVLRLQKMPARSLDETDRVANPMTWGAATLTSEVHGHQVHAAESWDVWRRSLDKRVRKEFERSWRVFTSHSGARFECITDPALALQAYAHLEREQAARMHETGQRYVLDRPAHSAFYRQLVEGGLADGSVVLTALRCDETWVAVLLGVANADRYIALRLVSAGGDWKACSPGRLCCERTGAHLREQGLHWFDLGIGAYFHKQIFKGTAVPLFDLCEALSWKGLPFVWAWRWRQRRKRAAPAAH